MIIANENTKYQLKQIITEIIYILNTELKQRTHYENDRISINHIPIINIFRGQRIGINTYEKKQHIQTHINIQPENECVDFCSFCL